MKTGKRLTAYGLKYKKIILAALLMLAISAAADLAGPFIAKNVIDQHILGIESTWYGTSNGKMTVEFKGKFYKRDDYFSKDEQKGKPIQILQVGSTFVSLGQELKFDGKRTFQDGILTVQNGNKEANYHADVVTGKELMAFYQPEIPRIFQLLAVYLALLVVSAFFQYGQRFYLQKSANRIIQKMREDVFSHIQELPINYFDNLPAGKVVARITNDTEAIRELYVTVLSNFFTSAIYIIGIYIAMFILNVKLALICLVLLPAIYIWMLVYRKYASVYNRVMRSRLSDLNAIINESIQGMTIIQSFRKEKDTLSEFEKLNGEYYSYQNKMQSLNALTSHNLVGVLRNLIFIAFIWYFGSQSLLPAAVISLGMLYAFVDYINRLFQPIQGIVNQLPNLEQALVAGERVFKLMDEPGEIISKKQMPRFKGNVRFEDVSFGYRSGENVLKNIQLEARIGETIALVGPTGSGKSSIMNLLFRFYDPQEGRITIDGEDIRKIPRQAVRKYMGIVLQDPYLFTGTISTNVSLNDLSITKEQVEKALKDVGANKVFSYLENGFEEPVREKGSTLSSGQRQLISFARALAFNPAILVLDEATSSIDSETEALIQEAMEALKKGRTTFIIAHRLSTIRNANQILVLDKGRIVERGTHGELMEVKGKYYQMYQLQQGNQHLAI